MYVCIKVCVCCSYTYNGQQGVVMNMCVCVCVCGARRVHVCAVFLFLRVLLHSPQIVILTISVIASYDLEQQQRVVVVH